MEKSNGKRFGTTAWHCGDVWAQDGGNTWVYGAFGGTSPEYYGRATYGFPSGDTYQMVSWGESYDAHTHHYPIEPGPWTGLEVVAAADTTHGWGNGPNENLCHGGYAKHVTYPEFSSNLPFLAQETGETCDAFISSSHYWMRPDETFPNGWWGAVLTDPSIEHPCAPGLVGEGMIELGLCNAAAYPGDSGAAVYGYLEPSNTAIIYGQLVALMLNEGYYMHPGDSVWFTESSKLNQVWNQPVNGNSTIATFWDPQPSS